MKLITGIITLLVLVLLAGAAYWYYVSPQEQIANPASVYCEQQGGTLEIVTTAEGQVGQCHLPDGRVCEEWSFYRTHECEETREVTLFYYSPANDQGPGGVQCSANGLVAVTRSLPVGSTIEEVIGRLLTGELTAEEQARGIETEFPLEHVVLVSAEQEGNTLTLTFDDPENKTGGGSCRVSILWHQIEATAKAFTGATEVRFMPEELFQP